MQSLNEFKTFVEELSKDNSRNYKLDILRKYSSNENIKSILKFIYDPFLLSGISDKKLNKEVNCSSNSEFANESEMSDIFNYLSENKSGRDCDIATVQQFRNRFANDCEDLFDKIITKNLQIGLDAKSINKVVPNLISVFNVQLANKYFDKPEIVEGKTFALTRKIDGTRIIAIKKNGEVNFFTRQGQEYIGLVDLKNALENAQIDNIALDGELTLLDSKDLVSGEQYKECIKLSRTKDAEKHGLKMLVFDAMTANDFENQSCDLSYDERRDLLNKIFAENKIEPFFDLLSILYRGNDTNKIEEILHEQVANGEEGIMINICNAQYKFSRSDSLLKCKLFQDLDLQVIGYEEGTGKNANRLGALICKFEDNEVKVGGGYSDEERDSIWRNRNEVVNKFIKVKYFEVTENANGGHSLRFPTFAGFREKWDM